MSAPKTMEVFPDLHHKMSKKIAQLTKVIYHLNTRNEDHQSEMDSLAANHQLEIQQVLKDAAARISKFKELMENKQATVNVEVQLSKLQKKHETEKQAAIAEFQALKEKSTAREQKIAKEFQSKFDAMRAEMEKINGKFQEKIEGFDAVNQELKKNLELAKKSGSSELAELKRKFDSELAEAIRVGNEKYQQLMIDQLMAQENIKKDAEKRIAAAVAAADEAAKSELERRLGQIRAELGGDKQEALMAQKREFESKMQAQREELMGKLEKVLADLRDKSQEYDRLKEENAKTVTDLNARIAELQRNMGDQLGGQNKQIQSLSDSLQAANEAIAKFKAEIAAKDSNIANLQKLLEEKESQLTDTDGHLRVAEGQISTLHEELKQLRAAGASSEAELEKRLSLAERDGASLRSEINTMAASMATLREELKGTKSAAQKAAQDAEKTIATLTAEKEALNNKLKEALQVSSSANSSLSSQVADLQKQLRDSEAAYRTQLAELEETNRRSLEVIRDRHRTELDSSAQEKRQALDAAAQRESTLKAEAMKLVSDHNAKLSALSEEHKTMTETMKQKHDEEISALKASISALETQMQSLADQADGEKGHLRGEVSKLTDKAKSLQKELDQKKKEFERAESVQNGLKSQIESLREELKATQKAYQEKMEMALAKLEADWQAKMSAINAENSNSVGILLEEARVSHRKEVEELIKAHAEEILVLKTALQKEASDAAEEIAKQEQERNRLLAELRNVQDTNASLMQSTVAKHTADVKKLEGSHKTELDRLRRELNGSAEARESQMSAEHEAALAKLRGELATAIEEAQVRLDKELEAAKRASAEAVRIAVSDCETRLAAEKADALAEQNRKHEAVWAEMTAENVRAYNKISGELEGVQSQLIYSKQQVADLQQQLASERTERQRREETFILEKDELNRNHTNDIRKEHELADRKLSEQSDRYNTALAALKQEFDDEKKKAEERLRALVGEYQALETRYRNRESRAEDLQRIQQLEREMVEKDELVEKTKEEMLYFKREMLNREENYNQKFGRSVNVGVMDVLKPKEAGPPAGKGGGGPGGAKATSGKPTYSMAASGSMPGSVGGIGGIGGGGLSVGGASGGLGAAPGQSSKPGKK